jgi:hypothetical protein
MNPVTPSLLYNLKTAQNVRGDVYIGGRGVGPPAYSTVHKQVNQRLI